MKACISLCLLAGTLVLLPAPPHVSACCPVFPSGKPVVNADQSVIIIWDAASKIEHFIRKASFKGEADDFGFIVPTPNQPELAESGNEAFPYLQELTEPAKVTRVMITGFCCSGCSKSEVSKGGIQILEQKTIAGFNAVVLAATSAEALVGWLKDNGFDYSPQVAAWAKPYVELGWKFTALKVAKDKSTSENQTTAAALRISFKTERPLFPYREPDSQSPAARLGARYRLLRIYFVAEARYEGELPEGDPWTGRAVWAGPLSAEQRQQALGLLKLPETTGPATWHLTEFEDPWPYKIAPGDLYFSPSDTQKDIRREPIVSYITIPGEILIAVLILAFLGLRCRRGRGHGDTKSPTSA